MNGSIISPVNLSNSINYHESGLETPSPPRLFCCRPATDRVHSLGENDSEVSRQQDSPENEGACSGTHRGNNAPHPNLEDISTYSFAKLHLRPAFCASLAPFNRCVFKFRAGVNFAEVSEGPNKVRWSLEPLGPLLNAGPECKTKPQNFSAEIIPESVTLLVFLLVS